MVADALSSSHLIHPTHSNAAEKPGQFRDESRQSRDKFGTESVRALASSHVQKSMSRPTHSRREMPSSSAMRMTSGLCGVTFSTLIQSPAIPAQAEKAAPKG